MKIIYPSQYCSPIIFYALIAQGYELVLEQHENYQKRSLRNKFFCLSANGSSSLSIPLKKGKNNQSNIKDVQISYDENWVRHHLSALKSNYGKSAFYEHYIDGYRLIISENFSLLFDLNLSLHHHFLNLLQIDYSPKFSDHYSPKGYAYDFRNQNKFNSFAERQKMDRYPQVFEDKFGFTPNLSILDLIFNLGPESKRYLLNIRINF